MNLSIDEQQLMSFVKTQINCFYPDGNDVDKAILAIISSVVKRLDYCFSAINKKYYVKEGKAVFNHLNSDHYAMFLYILANEAYQNGHINLAEKSFLLNKALHGIDAFYAIELPEIFLFVHPVGTVLGNAKYADYLVVYQNVTVGADIKGIYPSFGKANVLYSKCSVIGECVFGNNVTIAAHSFARNILVNSDSIFTGMASNFNIRNNSRNNHHDFFGSST